MKSRLDRIKSSIEDSNDRLSDDFKELLAASEDLLRSTASYAGEGVDDARGRLQRKLDGARRAANDWQRAASDRYTHYAKASDQYVKENPWKAVGAAALLGAVVSLILHHGRDH